MHEELLYSGIDQYLTLEEDVDMLEEAEFINTDTDYIDAVINVNETRTEENGGLFDYE